MHGKYLVLGILDDGYSFKLLLFLSLPSVVYCSVSQLFVPVLISLSVPCPQS